MRASLLLTPQPLRACRIKREKQHKTFKGITAKGQCSIGWFFGAKLHLIINDKGELLDFILTPGNIDDREPLKKMEFHIPVFGKLFGYKHYISKYLFETLFVYGVHLITKIRKNMMNLHDFVLSFTASQVAHCGLSRITLDCDSGVFPAYGNQQGAEVGYNPHKKGAKSYHPLLCFISKMKLLLNSWLRPGSAYTSNGICEFMKEIWLRFPKR